MTDLQSINARTGQPLGAAWAASTAEEIDAAVAAAAQAAALFAATSAAERAALLRDLAEALLAGRDTLVPLADRESGLGLARLGGELDRTAFQLRGFADVLERGIVHAVIDDAAVAGMPPAGRPRMLRVRVPLGPVAMFSASNFPFAFSVLGGDTAAALAAGCPVVVKSHPAHPELSRQTVALARQVVAARGLPAGVFQSVEGAAVETGVRLVQAPAIAAVAFTGSFHGGMALARVAAERARPIPFYGELGSVNPLVVLPPVVPSQGAALAETLAASICQGAGQFCTSPGLVIVRQDAAGDAFVQTLADRLAAQTPHAMLTPGIRHAFEQGVGAWSRHAGVQTLVPGGAGLDALPRPFLGQVQAGDFIADARLQTEVFGAAALVVRVDSLAQTLDVLRAVGGALAVTLWGADSDTPEPRDLVRAATQVAGRVLFAGVPTGVAVTAAQQHGGPFPASTAPATTSVGYAALDRFLRPVALQEAPAWVVNCRGLV